VQTLNFFFKKSSEIFIIRTLEILLKAKPLERVPYSVDMPFDSSITWWRFVEELAMTGLSSKEEMKQLLQGNANKPLKI
jgi:predicted TIM-barrel fold metal-dependent hydrolase